MEGSFEQEEWKWGGQIWGRYNNMTKNKALKWNSCNCENLRYIDEAELIENDGW